MDIRPDLSVCVLATESRPEILDRFLSSIFEMDDHLSMEIVILCGNETEKTSLESVKQFDKVKLIGMAKKSSLVSAMNQAVQISDGRYISLWCQDTVVESNCLLHLVEFLDAHPDVGIIAPELSSNNEMLPVARSFPSLFDLFSSSDMPGKTISVCDKKENIKVEWLTGPGLIINRHLIEEVGVLSERFPYYWTLEYCLRAVRRGWHIYYCQQVRAICSTERWNEDRKNRLLQLQEKIALALLLTMHRFRP